jgi:phage tail-like protein
MAPPTPDGTPHRNFNFRVEIDGMDATGFSEVVIPDAWITVVEYREGADKVSDSRKLPGRVNYGNVILRRGVTGALDLYEWWNAVRQGDLQRRTILITLLDAERKEVRRWKVERAWPVRYTGPTLAAQGNEIVVETLELAHEGIEIEGA